MTSSSTVPVDRLEASVYEFPTDAPESDGTLEWDSTTMILVKAFAGDRVGVGYTYAGPAVASVVTGKLSQTVQGQDALSPTASWALMQHQVRNLGKPGLVAEAISAADIALWDLYARLVDLPVSVALGAVHEGVPVYGSGGFTSYVDRQLSDQLEGWVDAGIPRVKMKVGRNPDEDQHRVAVARGAIGEDTELFVDANGAYSRKQALWWANWYAQHDIRWFEEPVSSDDLEGLRLLRDAGPGGLDIAAGEYGYHLPYFHQMLDAGAVDCLQADPTRCLGFSGLLRVAALCDARTMDLSLHCAPQASAHVGAAVWHLRHLEYFHDHVRIEGMVFDGVLDPQPGGLLQPDRSRPGLGLEVREADIEKYRSG
ncbi:MAG TPA: enolase C-terminal domain-like protein [Segeticoccus sp.]|uniref:enolase C-terminal domain-like protein n=1 Tax=Segeticoccus sp. TaxID=2706531 RepID=UPI002D7EA124|nr:enolase C-terminal domain-like protein [Segeticoccus sp.]HET8601914.1 enolase C-terminal domain-like protein [Segeticoccus sp.]